MMDNLLEILNILLKNYGPRHWWPASTPFEMMVGAILTQNTTWKNAEKALLNFGNDLSPEYLAAVDIEELASLIRPSGYYNQKALKLKALTDWFKKYSYSIYEAEKVAGDILRNELLAVKGIGPETADSILLYALNKPYFVVDAYTRRILSRLGYNTPKKYDDLRLLIEANLPADLYIYNEFHALIVEHAKQHCRKKPVCKGCPLEFNCAKRVTDPFDS